jgi:hypothetical protein
MVGNSPIGGVVVMRGGPGSYRQDARYRSPKLLTCGEHVYPQKFVYGSSDFVPSVTKWWSNLLQKEHGRYE